MSRRMEEERIRQRPTFVESLFFTLMDEERRAKSVEQKEEVVRVMENEFLSLALALSGLDSLYRSFVEQQLEKILGLELTPEEKEALRTKMPLLPVVESIIERNGEKLAGVKWKQMTHRNREEMIKMIAATVVRRAIMAALYKSRLLSF